MTLIHLEEPNKRDETLFLSMTNQSKKFHEPWVNAPLTKDEFNQYFQCCQKDNQKSYWVYLEKELVGVFNISEIVRGCFQSAYLGFYAFESHANKGLMSQGLKLLLKKVFTELHLHRMEANIQPANHTSIQLIKRNGFRKEGFSTRYLKINDQWCDHERWAITTEDWEEHKTVARYPEAQKYIRQLASSDILPIVTAFSNIGWNKPASLFEKYLKEQTTGTKWVWVAFHDEEFAGYVTLELRSEYAPFAKNNIPEIKDLNVLPVFRNQGIGSALLDCAEQKAKEVSNIVGIGVGLYTDYGNAQKLYVKRGYLPNGEGVTYRYKGVSPGKQVILDDDLVLWFTKKIATQGNNT